MSEMIERVARAILLKIVQRRDAWERASPNNREWYRSCARAAIATMREPTETMVMSNGAITGRDDAGHGLTERDAVRSWRAMIDAALAQGIAARSGETVLTGSTVRQEPDGEADAQS